MLLLLALVWFPGCATNLLEVLEGTELGLYVAESEGRLTGALRVLGWETQTCLQLGAAGRCFFH